MNDSDQQGFHRDQEEFTYIKLKNIHTGFKKPQQPFAPSPISLHYQLQLYQYPASMDHYLVGAVNHLEPPSSSGPLSLVRKGQGPSCLLSDFFPRKLHCVYNKFRQSLFKPDITTIIRNVGRIILNNQLTSFSNELLGIKQIRKVQFSSEFQGGNLHCVFKCKKTGCYYLLISNDTNTHGYNIWFNFKVRSATGGSFQFVIVNMSRPIKFCKDISLPTYSSENSSYQRNIRVECVESCFYNYQNNKNYYSLHFQYNFRKGESIYCSLIPPYSYSKLIRLISTLRQNGNHTQLSIDIVGKSELGNTIPSVVISHRQSTSRRAVIFTARQHPCQTVSSFICEHVIRLLTSESEMSRALLLNFTVYIVPMINPDGVIHGNSRTNLLGYDINRSWQVNSQHQSIQCKAVWEYIEGISRQKSIEWALDLHGHSKKLGFFCFFSQETEESVMLSHYLRLNSQYYFSEDCTFGVSRSKKESLRGQLYCKLSIKQAITIETSYYGYLNDKNQFQHWSQRNYSEIASAILQGLTETQRNIKNNKLKNILIKQIAALSPINTKAAGKKQCSLDSDSDPEDGYLRPEERQERDLEEARQLININYRRKEIAQQTVSGFKRSYLPTKQSQSKEIPTAQESLEYREKSHQLFQSQRKLTATLDQHTHMSTSTFHNVRFYLKKRERQTLVRQVRQQKLKRKVYSQHKYLINSVNKFDFPRKGSIKKIMVPRNESQLSSHSMRSSDLEKSREDSLRHTKSIKLQTILYPTSNFSEFSLNSQIIHLKAKAKNVRDPIQKQKLLSTFSEALKVRKALKK